jgi:16S rRNA (cytidine1402-2'-O)-methyltransferase
VVATPLGNPGDLSPRAREVLAAADLLLAEDTRRAGLLFQRLGIRSKGFLSLFEHNEEARIGTVLAALERGESVALFSDAGTPLLSDPGFRLVRACREAGFAVSPVPGPSAPAAALSASGLPPQPFVFLGFLPRKDGDIRRFLEPFAALPATLVFFERKTRLAKALALAAQVLGPRECCVCRELTKEHEEFLRGRLDDLSFVPAELLGEITVVVGPPEEQGRGPEADMLEALRRERQAGGRPKDVARRAAARVPGWSPKEAYELLAGLKDA